MQEYVFTGTYTQTKSKGIYGFLMKDGLLFQPELLAERESPTFLCVNKAVTRLYAVDEPEEGPGTLGAYAIQKDENGRITSLSMLSDLAAPSLGICHVVLSPDEKFLLLVSYFDATVQVYRIEEDGSIGEMTECLQRKGHGPNPVRQPSAHAHSITFAPDGSFLYVCDLGTDHLAAYQLTEEGKLTDLPEKTVEVPAGYGPRHMCFSPDGGYAYVAAEIVDHLLVYRYEDGQMTLVQDLLATRDQDPANTSAAVRVTRDGKYIYISNRGEDTITVYRRRPDGTLLQIQRISAQGRVPREFTLSLDEHYAYAGNQDSDTLSFYKRDPETGLLTKNGVTKEIGQPVCMVPVQIS